MSKHKTNLVVIESVLRLNNFCAENLDFKRFTYLFVIPTEDIEMLEVNRMIASHIKKQSLDKKQIKRTKLSTRHFKHILNNYSNNDIDRNNKILLDYFPEYIASPLMFDDYFDEEYIFSLSDLDVEIYEFFK